MLLKQKTASSRPSPPVFGFAADRTAHSIAKQLGRRYRDRARSMSIYMEKTEVPVIEAKGSSFVRFNHFDLKAWSGRGTTCFHLNTRAVLKMSNARMVGLAELVSTITTSDGSSDPAVGMLSSSKHVSRRSIQSGKKPHRMKKTLHASRALIATALFSALAALASAALPSNSSKPIPPVTTLTEAAHVRPGDTVIMVCGACKTVELMEAVYMKRTGAEIDDYGFEWLTVGSKHTCDHCGGEISVVKGQTTDSMRHNCSKCGDGAAFCCAVPKANAKN